ncbi:MAG: FAD:protein FMN transferase [Deltaproteobacteria bacterium]|nr:FAD:protein FMN transferase [Deltaproteobacteria bacterium]
MKAKKHAKNSIIRNPYYTIILMIVSLVAVLAYIWKTTPAQDDGNEPGSGSVSKKQNITNQRKAFFQTGNHEFFTSSRTLLGTVVTIQAGTDDPKKAVAMVRAGFKEIRRLLTLLGPTGPGRPVSEINASSGGPPVKVGTDLMNVLVASKKIADLTGGAFDPTWAVLAPFRHSDKKNSKSLDQSKVASAVKLVDYQLLILDRENSTARLEKKGMALDLAEVAKGYAADRAAQVLAGMGCKSALINVGGNIHALGGHDSKPWEIGIKDPSNSKKLLGTVAVRDMALATSGNLEKSFSGDGPRYHQILDPRTGMPARNTKAVSVIAPTGIEAGALKAAFFVMGPKDALKLANKLENIEMLIVDPNDRIMMTPGFTKVFKINHGK